MITAVPFCNNTKDYGYEETVVGKVLNWHEQQK